MKKYLIFVALIAVISVGLTLLPLNIAYATNDNNNDNIEFVGKDVWTEFCSSYPNRTAFGEGEKQASDYIQNKFSEFGLIPFFGNQYIQQISYGQETSQNVVAIKPSVSNDSYTVVIGAHYDNVFTQGASGATDNASGIAILLSIAKTFSQIDLNFNLIFACFGAEEYGMVGSYTFVSNLTESQINNTILYVNLDSIAAGDMVYIHAEEKPTEFATFILNNYNNSQLAVSQINATNTKGLTFYKDGYSAAYFNTDSVAFREVGIPSVSFFSGNLDYAYCYVESQDYKKRVMHTSFDSVDKITSFGNNALKNMQSVYDCLTLSLLEKNFVDVMSGAKDELIGDFWYNSFLVKIAVFVLLCLVLLICYRIMQKMRKRALMKEQGVKNFRIFFQPNDEELFTF